MAVHVRMPALGESVTEGTVTRWLKQEGDRLEEGEALLEVSTDKVDTEIPSPVSGVLTSILAAEDDTVPVGYDLATVDETADAATPAAAPSSTPAAESPVAVRSPAPPQADAPDADVFATASVRALAREHGVSLTGLVGSGPAGRIRRQDVHAVVGLAPWQPAAGPTPGTGSAPMTHAVGRESAPAAASTNGHRVCTPTPAPAAAGAGFTAGTASLVREVDVTRVEALRAAVSAEFAAREGTEPTFVAFVATAVADGLRATPVLNGGPGVHLALDSAAGGRVVVADADGLSFAGMARRSATAGSGDTAPTFTVAVGEDVLAEFPALRDGAVAVLGVGAPVKRVRVRSGPDGEALAPRAVCLISLVYDEQRVSRAEARAFLTGLADRLEGCRFDVRVGS